MTVRVSMAEVKVGFKTLRTIVTFGLKMTPGFLATGFSEASGTWILGATSSVATVGAFSRAWNFATRLTEVNWRITEMLLPTLVQHRHTGDHERFDRVLVDSLRYAAFGMLLPAAVGGGAAEAVMRIFGEGFDSAAMALRLLLFVPLLQTLTAIQSAALVAHGRPLLTALAQIVRVVVTVSAGVLLTIYDGITGMAIAMAAGSLACFVVYVIILKVRVGTSMPTLFKPRQLVGFLGAYGAGFLVARELETVVHGAFGLLVALIGGTLAYVVCGLVICGTTEHDRARVRAVMRRLGGSGSSPVGASGTA